MRKYAGSCCVLILALATASCGGGDGIAGGGGGGGGGGGCPADTFCMGGSFFTPIARTVTAGTTVTWKNDSGVNHNVVWNDAAGRAAATPGDGSGDLGEFSSGSHTRKFNTAGSFAFHCTLHGGMNGALTVQ